MKAAQENSLRPTPLHPEGVLLYAVAALRVDSIEDSRWFGRAKGSCATVISTSEDVKDILMRVPEEWIAIEGARMVGIHDDEDIQEADVRFKFGADQSTFAVLANQSDGTTVALMVINAAEAAFLEHAVLEWHGDFGACLR